MSLFIVLAFVGIISPGLAHAVDYNWPIENVDNKSVDKLMTKWGEEEIIDKDSNSNWVVVQIMTAKGNDKLSSSFSEYLLKHPYKYKLRITGIGDKLPQNTLPKIVLVLADDIDRDMGSDGNITISNPKFQDDEINVYIKFNTFSGRKKKKFKLLVKKENGAVLFMSGEFYIFSHLNNKYTTLHETRKYTVKNHDGERDKVKNNKIEKIKKMNKIN